MNIQDLRQLFPVTENLVFLNSAAESPLNKRFRSRLEEYLELVNNEPHKKPSPRNEVRLILSELLGGSPEEYALVTSTGVGIGITAAGYNWHKGDNVVVTADEHWNNNFPWLALKERGVDVRIVELDSDNRVNLERIAAMTDHNTRIVATAAVRFNSGFRVDLKKISDVAHNCGALFVVDGIQGAGVVPINVDKDGIDVLSAAGFKWLLGMPGTGFLYVRKSAQEKITPVLPGMFAADNNSMKELKYFPDARRYETGTIAYSLFYAWIAGLELLKEVGIENIYKRVLMLTDLLIAGLQAKNMTIITPVDKIENRSAILLFSAGSPKANEALCEKLLSKGIIITYRSGLCRVSPSFFNTEEEINRFLQALE